jgi:hypothetical protein
MQAITAFTYGLAAVQTIAAVSGIVKWEKWKHIYLKNFVFYLCVISFLGICNLFLLPFNRKYDIAIINQIAVPLEMFFINWFFYKTLDKKNNWLMVTGACVYTFAWVLEKTLLSSKGYYFDSLSYTLGNLFVLIYLIIFFKEFVQSEKLVRFKVEPTFWIASGMLIFYLGTFPFYGLYNELAKDLTLFFPVAWIATGLNYCMYILFSIGLIWGKPH